MRVAAALLVLLAPALAPAADENPGAPFRRAAEAIAARADEIRPGERGSEKELRQLLDSVRGQLADEGVDERLARVLCDAHTSPEAVDRSDAAQRLEAVRLRLLAVAEASGREPSGEIDVEQARAMARTILEDDAFERKKLGEPGLVTRILAWIQERLGRLLWNLFGEGGANETIARAMVAAIIVAALLLLSYLLAQTRLERKRRGRDPGAAELPAIDVAAGTTAGRLIELARQSWERRRGPDALGLLGLAAVVALRDRGALPGRPGLTDLEGSRLLEDPALAEPFASLTAIRERVVYGGHRPTEDDFARALDDCRRLVPATEG